MTEKEIVLERKNLSISREWKEIRKHLLEDIKNLAKPGANYEFITAMLYTIDAVDSWQDDFEKVKKREDKKGV
jgi:molecular chaperone GrpE (heat shock protein)